MFQFALLRISLMLKRSKCHEFVSVAVLNHIEAKAVLNFFTWFKGLFEHRINDCLAATVLCNRNEENSAYGVKL